MRSTDSKVAVLGIGGGGVCIAAQFARLAGDGPFEVGAADTDARSLQDIPGVIGIPLGQEWDCSAGCGGNPQLGEKAAGASADALREFIEGHALLIVVAGLGGGTGSGGVRTVARLAREARIPCFFMVTTPFAFEGNWRRQQAQKVLAPLRQLTDSVIVVQSDLLFTTLDADTRAGEAFELADGLLAKCIHGLASMARADWMITADFAAIKGLLREFQEDTRIGIGCGNGENRWQQAIEEFVRCPLVGGPESMAQANAAVVTLLTREEISVGELQASLSSLQKYFPEKARVIAGACSTPLCVDEIQVTGVLCRKTAPSEAATEIALEEEGQLKPADDRSRSKVAPPGKREQKRQAAPVQGELPLQEQALGIFSGSRPTSVKGENLDIPTFQRRGIHIDAGD